MKNIPGEVLLFLRCIKDVSIGYSELNFYTTNAIVEGQIGYQVDEGDMLNQGDWQKEWLVIAIDQLGDPIFINSQAPDFPVFTAMRGEGTWERVLIAQSLTSFEQINSTLHTLSAGRSNPVEFENNPISNPDRKLVLDQVKLLGADAGYWAEFIEQ